MSKIQEDSELRISVVNDSEKPTRDASALLHAISATQLAALVQDDIPALFTELLAKTIELIECMFVQEQFVSKIKCLILYN